MTRTIKVLLMARLSFAAVAPKSAEREIPQTSGAEACYCSSAANCLHGARMPADTGRLLSERGTLANRHPDRLRPDRLPARRVAVLSILIAKDMIAEAKDMIAKAFGSPLLRAPRAISRG